MNLQGSVALVTGANRGLGRAFVEALLAAGARRVYAAARDPSRLELCGAEPLRLDITVPAQVEAAAAVAADVTLLVNNAGVLQAQPLLAPGGLEAARAQFETNVLGTLAMCRAFAPVLRANGGGAIVNVLSALSWLTLPGVGGYAASKSAAWSLSNSLRNELRGQGTRVLAVHPAFIDTDMARAVSAPKASPRDVAARALEALAQDLDEVLTDEPARQIKRGLVAEPPAYAQPWRAA